MGASSGEILPRADRQRQLFLWFRCALRGGWGKASVYVPGTIHNLDQLVQLNILACYNFWGHFAQGEPHVRPSRNRKTPPGAA